MVTNTPTYGFPYPDNTDQVKAAVKTIPQSLAQQVEATLAALYAGGIPGAGWTALPYAANWADVGGGNQAGRYMKWGSEVIVEAYPIRNVSASGAAATIATLPAGFRPLAAVTPFSNMQNAGGAFALNQIQVLTTGAIVISNSVAAGTAVPLYGRFHVN
jgi:hypothetical protein